MFSINELKFIREVTKDMQEHLQGHIQSPVFSNQEKLNKLREIDTAAEIINRVDTAENKYMAIDADQLGELYCFLNTYKKSIQEQCERGEISAMEFATKYFIIGNLTAKVEFGLLTAEEFNELQMWQEEME